MPAEAGIHLRFRFVEKTWIPVFTGMTESDFPNVRKRFERLERLEPLELSGIAAKRSAVSAPSSAGRIIPQPLACF
jgi:hypothetical protein